ncbi:putative biopolymer transport protein ExbB [Azoarcus olearius]|uniref:MotA/TolQ/ExbB proton channel family protein n=1 Tax=Azoarcus sp. (strain BH72) TaxID=418699 RepID=UPI0008060F5E|nr:MotA/TolQ/ExbB proton channel family protein [Azoarcus olearius]ANQ83323.1 putative biopolymer transport protein ExbB [Azoarcus olearius]
MKLRRFFSSLSLAFAIACGAVSAPAVAQSAPATTAGADSAPAVTGTIDAAPTAKPAAAAAAKVENPYGLEALWAGSDAVAKVVLVLMIIMSAGSWYIIIVKLIEQTRMYRQAKAVDGVWKSATIKHGAENLENGSPFRFIAEAGLEATNRHDSLLEHVDLNDWVTLSIHRAIEKVQSRMQNGLAFLATVGSTAPFVGLFGTVWGIYHALTAIGIAGQASIDKVAGPVGEALIMTAIGLAVAVPAVLGYNWLVRRNKGVMDQVRGFGNELHTVILSSAKRA